MAEGETDPDVCRIIWKTPVYPDYNFSAHPILEERYGTGFTDKLQMALIDIRDPDLLSAFPRKAMISATNEDFESIRTLASELDFIR